jgi:hypothetical protein
MSCLLPLIAGVCLASPQGLTLEMQSDWMVAGAVEYNTRAGVYKAALARPAILMNVPVGKFDVDYGLTHFSALTAHDRGAEYFTVRVQWRPFK